MQVVSNVDDMDRRLLRLQEILLEEVLRSQRSAVSAASNEGAYALKLNSALARIEELENRTAELENAAAQSELTKNAAFKALREAQLTVRRLQEESDAHKLHAAETNASNAELNKKIESLNNALAESQHAADVFEAALADKGAELHAAASRCHTLESAAAHIAPAEVSRLKLQLRMRDDAASEESKRTEALLSASEQSLEEAKVCLDDALRSNALSSAEWKARHERKCDEYLKTIEALQQTIQQNSDVSAILSERDRLRSAYHESNEHASALSIKAAHLQYANSQLKQQLDALARSSPSPAAAATASPTVAPVDKARNLSVEVHVLKRELADARSRAVAGEGQDSRRSHEPPAFFITERQYSLLVEENAQLIQDKAQLARHVEALKQQLYSSIRSQHQREDRADEMSHFTLDALCEFCVGLGQRLDGIELAVMQQLRDDAR
jgi:hypothetical protein